ncbi:MAG: hypothetical protein IPJ98_14795 [Bryobacterales bacterium]|nr:hypothetical protein [Bryobacterales bacterium]
MPYQILLSTYRKLPLACFALGLLHAEPLTPTNVLDYRQARLADGDLIRVVDDIKLTGDEIVLLARTGAGRSHIVFVQLSNRSMRSIPLDFKPGSHWLALHGDQVLLPQRSRDVKGKVHDTLITLSRSGSVVAARQLPAPVETILSDGSSLVAIQPDGAPSRLPQLSPPPNQGAAFGRPARGLVPCRRAHRH